MSIEQKFVPMSEANTVRVRTTATLPFQLHEEVGLNLKRIDAICQVGGFQYLKIQNDPKGETSHAVPQIVGIDRSGSAVAGKVRLKEAPTFQSEYTPDTPAFYLDRMKQGRWKNLTILLNTEEMKRRILSSDARVTDPSEWGNEINKALKMAMVKNGTRHLVKDLDRFDQFFTLLFYSLVYSDEIISLAKGESGPLETLSKMAGSLAITGMVMTTLYSTFYGVEKPGKGRRISLFYGPELDRTAVLLALAYTSRLAKGISKDKQNNSPVRTNPRS